MGSGAVCRGGYALAVGSDRSFKEHPNYSRGELVEVDGRTFKIMATVYLPDRMTQGGSYHMFVPEIVIPGTDSGRCIRRPVSGNSILM